MNVTMYWCRSADQLRGLPEYTIPGVNAPNHSSPEDSQEYSIAKGGRNITTFMPVGLIPIRMLNLNP